MSAFILILITGIGLGALYFLVASGLSLIYGLMGVLNFAHGSFLTIGAFTGLWISTKVFPNPTTGIFNLSFNTQQESDVQIQILNSLGSLILEETIFIPQKPVEKQIDISNFPSGLYLLKVTYCNSIYTIKIIKN
jgi:branched-subunit amino acid ABC-type transport system permease component